MIRDPNCYKCQQTIGGCGQHDNPIGPWPPGVAVPGPEFVDMTLAKNMTKRENFALEAMKSIILAENNSMGMLAIDTELGFKNNPKISYIAVRLADALCEELSKPIKVTE